MRRLDRKGAIRFVDARDAAVSCPVDRVELLARFHVREGEGPLLSGVPAFAAMWRAIPVLRPFARLAGRPAVSRRLERLYDRFLRIRPRLQRLVRRWWRRG